MGLGCPAPIPIQQPPPPQRGLWSPQGCSEEPGLKTKDAARGLFRFCPGETTGWRPGEAEALLACWMARPERWVLTAPVGRLRGREAGSGGAPGAETLLAGLA